MERRGGKGRGGAINKGQNSASHCAFCIWITVINPIHSIAPENTYKLIDFHKEVLILGDIYILYYMVSASLTLYRP